eukprot:jgi/Ulvmu1/9468/UM052_0037.1
MYFGATSASRSNVQVCPRATKSALRLGGHRDAVSARQALQRIQKRVRRCAAEAVQSDAGQLETIDISNGPRKAVIKIFSDKDYEDVSFDTANTTHGFKLQHLNVRLTEETAGLAAGAQAVSVFVNDEVNEAVLERLAEVGVKCVALRCAGYNNVAIDAATRLGITVVRVPAYSPNAVAEHTLALILALNRNIHRAYNRVRDRNFSLSGLVGFDLAGKTAGVVGTGRIGTIVARLLWHLRCRVLAVDIYEDPHLLELGVEYVSIEELIEQSEIITLNCPLLDSTYHLINDSTIARMRDGVMIVNTGRGKLIDTPALVRGLKSGKVGSVALDVYEEEDRLFFEDRSSQIIADDTFSRLLTFPNVLMTAHQAFLTKEALQAIATTTLDNVAKVLAGQECPNRIN